jgi:hypothetical protein
LLFDQSADDICAGAGGGGGKVHRIRYGRQIGEKLVTKRQKAVILFREFQDGLQGALDKVGAIDRAGRLALAGVF